MYLSDIAIVGLLYGWVSVYDLNALKDGNLTWIVQLIYCIQVHIVACLDLKF